jgi:predicted site-specific integrase-resolvase
MVGYFRQLAHAPKSHDQQTLPLQIKAMRGYARRRVWNIGAEIREIGSGASQRSKRKELLAAIRRRELDAVIVCAWTDGAAPSLISC